MIAVSDIDSARFALRVAKASPASEGDWGEALVYCRRHSVELLIARIDALRLALAQRMEADGAFLTDVLAVYRGAPSLRAPADAAALASVRPCRPAEAETVRALARRSFRGYVDHYHADPRLPREACDEVYADWAYRSCVDRSVADEVLVAEAAAGIVGFAALRMSAPGEADGMLFGVDPEARGRGVFGALVAAFLAWAERRHARSATYATQLANPATHRTLARCGFAIERSHLTFHQWFATDSRSTSA
jgi:GNAT superfamily N-acetyltransferase